MDMFLVLVVMITFFIIIVVEGIFFVFGKLMYDAHKKKNNIDFTIVEIFDNGAAIRNEIGKKINDPDYGNIYVTSKGILRRGYKDNLGAKIDDSYFRPSLMGFKRKHCFVAYKDGIFSPVVLSKLPDTLSLTPIQYEATSFWLDSLKANHELNKPLKNPMMPVILGTVAILFVLILGIIIIFVLAMTQGPGFAEQMKAVQNIELPPS